MICNVAPIVSYCLGHFEPSLVLLTPHHFVLMFVMQ